MICIQIRYGNSHGRYVSLSGSVSQMTLYPMHIPCIAGISHVSRINLVSYDTVTFAFQLQKPGRVARPGKIPKKKIPFFMDQFWKHTLKNPKFTRFPGSGLCDPSDIAGEPFCIQEFCLVTYQLIWRYSQKPLTFSSFMASNTYTLCFSTLYMFDFD